VPFWPPVRHVGAAQEEQVSKVIVGMDPHKNSATIEVMAGQARRRVAAELIVGLERARQRKKAAGKELTAALKATGTTLIALDGIGPSGAARLLAEPPTSPGSPAGGTSPPGTEPRRPAAPSGDHVRHRLSRAGNRQINRVLHPGWPCLASGPRRSTLSAADPDVHSVSDRG
jgi:hypothetical protein